MNIYIEGSQTDPDGPISSLSSDARFRHGRKVSRDDQDRGELIYKVLYSTSYHPPTSKIWVKLFKRAFDDELFRMQTWKW